MIGKECCGINVNDILFNWEACLPFGSSKRRRIVSWDACSHGVLKFNADGTAKSKSGPVGIGWALRDGRGVSSTSLSTYDLLAALECAEICHDLCGRWTNVIHLSPQLDFCQPPSLVLFPERI